MRELQMRSEEEKLKVPVHRRRRRREEPPRGTTLRHRDLPTQCTLVGSYWWDRSSSSSSPFWIQMKKTKQINGKGRRSEKRMWMWMWMRTWDEREGSFLVRSNEWMNEIFFFRCWMVNAHPMRWENNQQLQHQLKREMEIYEIQGRRNQKSN